MHGQNHIKYVRTCSAVFLSTVGRESNISSMRCSTTEILLGFIEAIITEKHRAAVFNACWPLHTLNSRHRWRRVGTPLLGEAGNRLPVYKTDFSKGMTARAFLKSTIWHAQASYTIVVVLGKCAYLFRLLAFLNSLYSWCETGRSSSFHTHVRNNDGQRDTRALNSWRFTATTWI